MLSNKGRHDTTKLGSSVVQELKINQRRILIDSLEIGIPAPEQMIALGERQLPSGVKVGQLLNSKTLNYKKFTPHRDGLFCERIFGPVQSFVCACGKKKESVQNKSRHKDIVKANLLPPPLKAELHQNERYTRSPNNVPVPPQTESPFCPKCQVEYISKNVRRHRLGHIKLFAPVTHIWYLKGRPSYLSLFLGKRKKAMTSLAYCNAYLVEQVYSDFETQNLLKDTDKSVNALVKKSSVTVWKNTGSNDLDGKGEKDKPAKGLEESLFPTVEDFSKAGHTKRLQKLRFCKRFVRGHLDLPLSSKPSERFSFDSMNNGKFGSHQKNLYKTKTDLKNQNRLKDSGGESFLSLLTQLFPKTLTQSLQTNKKAVTERSLKAVPTKFDTKLKQGKPRDPVSLHSSFVKQTKGSDINLYRVTSLKNRSVRQDVQNVQISKLAAKKLRYKVSTNLEGVKYFVETSCKTTKQSFGNTDLLSIGRGQSKISPIPYIRAQALPFLPSLICPFHLRDCLISFLQSLPCAEDIPIPIYCQTPRRYPLRDVHKFLAELRSTNTQDQTERLTNESVTRFIGLSKQASKPSSPVRRPYSDIIKVSSASSNQRKSKGNGASTKPKVTKTRYTGTGMYTKRLQKRNGYLQNKHSFTPPSFLKNEHRYIVVHKPHNINLFSQIKVGLFASLNPKDNHPAFSIWNKSKQSSAFRNRVDSSNQPPVISKNKWDNKRVFVGARARTTKRIFTLNGLSVGKENNKTCYNQKVNLFHPIQLNKDDNKGTGYGSFVSKSGNQSKALFARVSERQIEVNKALPKLALVPLGLSLLPSSNVIRDSFVTPHKSSRHTLLKQSVALPELMPKVRCTKTQFLDGNCFGTTGFRLQETKLSLRGVLLSTFFNTITAGLTEFSLPLPLKQLQVNGIKQVGFRRQRKQTVTSPNSKKTITNNKVVLTSKVPEPLAKQLPKTSYTKTGFYRAKAVPLQSRALYTITCSGLNQAKLGLTKNPVVQSPATPKLRSGKYTTKRISFACLPKLDCGKNSDNLQPQSNQTVSQFVHRGLFSRQIDKNVQVEIGKTPGLFLFKKKKEFQYKYTTKRFTYLYVPTLLYARQSHFEKSRVNLTEVLFGLPGLRHRHRSALPANLSSQTNVQAPSCNTSEAYAYKASLSTQRTFAQMYGISFAIDTYQARLLHIAFGTLQKHIPLKRLPRYKNEMFPKLGFGSATANLYFLHKKKELETGCTYLLTTNQQEQRQGQVYKNKNKAKVKGNGVQTFANNSLVNFSKVQPDFGVPGQGLVQSPAKPKPSFGTYQPEFGSGVQKQSLGSNSNSKTKPSVVTPTPLGSETISKWHINGAKEILSYTGGGALESLLKRFNISLFCQFLLGEVQTLRKHYKDRIVAEYNTNQIVAEHGFDLSNQEKPLSYKANAKTSFLQTLCMEPCSVTTNGVESKGSLQKRSFCIKSIAPEQYRAYVPKRSFDVPPLYTPYKKGSIPKQSSTETGKPRVQENNSYSQSQGWLVRQNFVSTRNKSLLSSSKIATKDTLDHKEQDLGLQYVVTDKSANLFCRRIYRTTRRLKVVQLLMTSKRRPEWMMISVLPVLPPDLRPVLQMGDNLIVASDLNTLYQRVIYRNNRHYKGRFLDFHFVSSIHRLVQDAVDRLIENGKGGSTPFLTPGGRPLLSLSDILKGKRGRFRFNLLGKRVDFSGRSVIVVDPNLKIHECGLPREMALELYKYLLIRQLLLQKRASSIVNAKRLIKQRKPFIWDVLRQIIYYHPLLLNRAPTLHRLGIQAFQPKLVLGNAILLHPLVCAGFNADFDGDQMGVHLPLSPQARAEAWDLLWSRNNLLSPATGQPILLPSQDMVLGFYYMTSLLPYGTTNKGSLSYRFPVKNEEIKTSSPAFNNLLPEDQTKRLSTKPTFVASNLGPGFLAKSLIKGSYNFGSSNQGYKNKIDELVVHVFSDKFQVVHAYQNKQIDIHTPIWYKWVGKSENGEKSQIPVEIRIDTFGDQTQIYSTHQSKNKMCKGVNTRFFSCHIRTTVGRVLVNNLINKEY